MGTVLSHTARYKTTYCKNELVDSSDHLPSCKYGLGCLFAHSTADLRRDPLMHYYEPVRSEACTPEGGGACPRGDDCPYAHNDVEIAQHPVHLLRRLRQLAAWSGAPPSGLDWFEGAGDGMLQEGELLDLADLRMDAQGFVLKSVRVDYSPSAPTRPPS